MLYHENLATLVPAPCQWEMQQPCQGTNGGEIGTYGFDRTPRVEMPSFTTLVEG
jgi:hypothetical protein